MNEYVVLATQYMNVDDPESELCEWTVGTREQVSYWIKKWEEQGYKVNVRKCTHPLDVEFFKAGLNYDGKPM